MRVPVYAPLDVPKRMARADVDESNAAARRMYARLGFTEHHRDRVYTP